MKVLLKVFFVFVLGLAKITYAQDFSILEHEFNSSSVLSGIHYGFGLYDLDREEFVFGKQENQYFTPASNTKVYTLFSSLRHLNDSIPGIEYIIKGDSLIFWGTGDPSFLHPKLDNRVVYDFLKKSDKKLFYAIQKSSEPAYRNGWSVEDFQEYYQVDIVPFPIYGNLVHFYVDNTTVKTKPSYFNDYLISVDEGSAKFYITRDQYSNRFDYSKYNIPKDVRVNKPFIWSDSLFVNLLQDTLKKEVSMITEYPKPSERKTFYSVSRNTLLREMMLPSDNFLAEQLTMLISHTIYGSFRTDSLRVLMQREFYGNFSDSVDIRDGSGLSTYNKITPRNMIDVLLAINEWCVNEDQRNYFFPMGGMDGTLRTAYTFDLSEPFIWAKTGTINSVHCQSGFIVTREGRRFAFSFLNNNYIVPTSTIRKEMIRIMTFIRQNY